MSAPAMGPSLETHALEVRRGDSLIVRGLHVRHVPGSVAWVTGPNGAGKSSLMRVLAGLAAPDGGRVVRVGGTGDARAGYYHPGMSLPRAARAASFRDLLARLVPESTPLVPDRSLGAKRCGALSTGEQKRLLLGGILAAGRPFLLLDEPYEHLSAGARAALTRELARVAESAVVVVATNQPVPEALAGPVVTLGHGADQGS